MGWRLLPKNPETGDKPKFDWVSAVEMDAVKTWLYLSMGFALCAGILSYTRTIGHKKELHM